MKAPRTPAKLIPIEGGVRIIAPDGAVYDLKSSGILSSTFIPSVFYKELSESKFEEAECCGFVVYVVPVIEGGLYGVRVILEKTGVADQLPPKVQGQDKE